MKQKIGKKGSRKKILLLEDELSIGQLYTSSLERVGFEVKWVQNTQQAEASAADFQPDLILLDHGIKGEERSGMDLVPFFKANVPRGKVVILSNYNQFQLEQDKGHPVEYLLKIDTPPSLLAKKALQALS